jgi:hypothetical protein
MHHATGNVRTQVMRCVPKLGFAARHGTLNSCVHSEINGIKNEELRGAYSRALLDGEKF